MPQPGQVFSRRQRYSCAAIRQDELRLRVRLTPRPAEQAETGEEADRTGDGPERAAGHRRTLDQPGSLADPDDAGQDEHGSDDTPRDDHSADYAGTADAGLPRALGS